MKFGIENGKESYQKMLKNNGIYSLKRNLDLFFKIRFKSMSLKMCQIKRIFNQYLILFKKKLIRI